MAHTRVRLLQGLLESELKWSPAVGFIGLRQVGKTTLLESIHNKLGGKLKTLDNDAVLQSAFARPIEFCSHSKLLCIDEVQKAPSLFPAIKNVIGTKRAPGRFLITGSIRFTLKKEVRESLTGRVLLHELLPFSIAETRHLRPSVFLNQAFEFISHRSIEKFLDNLELSSRGITLAHTKNISYAMKVGGMPVVCFTHDTKKREAWFNSYFETMITRDLPMVDESLSGLSIRQGLSFLKILALFQGIGYSATELAAKSGLKIILARKFLKALEILCMIDPIPPEVLAEKTVKKPRLEWKDIGLWNFLMGLDEESLKQSTQAMELVLSQEFRFQTCFASSLIYWNFYRSRDGAEIPWIFRQGQKSVAIKFIPSESIPPYEVRVLKKFLEKEKHSMAIILGSAMAPPTMIDTRIYLVPYWMVF